MRRDGNVLICVDTAGRVLELALLLVRFIIHKKTLFIIFDILGTIVAE
jgi:Cft2 family RNA processing exonuclease